MNDMSANQCKDILGSFASDSTGLPDTSQVRARERRDSHIFYFRDWHNIRTPKGSASVRKYQIYVNSFSRKLNKFHETGRVAFHPHKLVDWKELASRVQYDLSCEKNPQKIKELKRRLRYINEEIAKIEKMQVNQESDNNAGL